MGAVTPLHQIGRKVPIQGRIRLGTKSPKGYPTSLSTFRFTSQDRQAIIQIAEQYGGSPAKWRKEFEVITETDTLPVLLPPDPLGDSPNYELWSGGGRLRTCDGETAMVPNQTPDGVELEPTDCICEKKNVLECSVSTRLTVILRDISFGGAWMLASNGWYAAQELPGMVDMVMMAQTRGLTKATLRLEKREKKEPGQPMKKFVVPVLSPDVSLEELAAGAGSVGYLAPAPSDDVLEIEANEIR